MASHRTRKKIFTLTGRKIGNWQGVQRFIDELGPGVKNTVIWAQWKVAQDIRKRVVGHILAQDLNWPPLTDKTRSKKTQNHKNKIYIDTETYLNSIRSWREADRVYVGIKKGSNYKKKRRGPTVDQVAIWMEYGTRNMPARPLWNPTILEVGGAKGIRDFIAMAIYKKIKRLSSGKPITVTYNDIRKIYSTNATVTQYR